MSKTAIPDTSGQIFEYKGKRYNYTHAHKVKINGEIFTAKEVMKDKSLQKHLVEIKSGLVKLIIE